MITKFSTVEIKTMLMHHTSVIHKWASGSTGTKVPMGTKEVLKDTAARLFELIEELEIEPDQDN